MKRSADIKIKAWRVGKRSARPFGLRSATLHGGRRADRNESKTLNLKCPAKADHLTMYVGTTLLKIAEMYFFNMIQNSTIQIINRETENSITDSKERLKELYTKTKS